MRLPNRIEDISPEWMTAAFAAAFPGARVTRVEVVDVVSGACTKVRLALTGDDPKLPPTVLMKAGFEAHSPRMQGMHRNELHAYRDLLPTVALNTPACHAAVEDAEDGRALVILEDLCLRDVRFLSLQEPIGFDLAAAFLEGLARLHARWWDSPELATRFAWAPDTTEAGMAHYFGLLLDPASFRGFATAPRGAAMPRMVLDPPRIRAAHAAMREAHARLAQVVNHGDMHLGNLYTDADGAPGFLDMQPRRGPWAIDVSYFLVAGLDLIDRRRWEGALIQHYVACLAANGVASPSFDQAWVAYRQTVVWGLLIWMLNGSHFQTEANNTAAATRFAMAMVDLDTFSVLGV